MEGMKRESKIWWTENRYNKAQKEQQEGEEADAEAGENTDTGREIVWILRRQGSWIRITDKKARGGGAKT